MKKLYFAGSGGMLGDAFYKYAHDKYILKCSDKDPNDKWLSKLDFRNYDNYFKDVNNFKPDILFHIGAYTDLEFCEKNKEDTFLTNTISVEYAVKIANNLSIPLVFISTAGIFDGHKDFYDDWDMPNPMGYYAKSKYAAEKYIINYSNNYLICRAGWMMGGGPKKDKKFINKIMKKINEGERSINVVEDKLGTPTYTHDFVKNIFKILDSNNFGLFNLVCEGKTSRYEVAKEIINILNLENKIKINKVNSEFFSKEYFAPRPRCENLINLRLNILSLNIMRDWKICLKEYLQNEF